MPQRARTRSSRETGRAASGLVVAVVLLAVVGVVGFFYFGGQANVDIKKPNVSVSTSPK